MIINLINCNCLDSEYMTIEVYNKKNNLIFKKSGRKNIFLFDIDYGFYKLYIYKNKCLLNIFIIQYTKESNCFTYKYNYYREDNIIKIYLYDYHYPGLKVERGRLSLITSMI